MANGNGGLSKKAIDEFTDCVCAGVPAIYIRTYEGERAIKQLPLRMVKESQYTPASWDCIRGLCVGFGASQAFFPAVGPLDPLNWLSGREIIVDAPDGAVAPPKPPKASDNTILFLWNYHPYLCKDTGCGGGGIPETTQTILDNIAEWKAKGKTIVVVSPLLHLPAELEKVFTVIDFPLPDASELERTLKTFIEDVKVNFEGSSSTALAMPEGAELREILRAMTGMTEFEAETALSLSMVKNRKFVPEDIAALKTQFVKKNASLEISNFNAKFSELCGLENLKGFALKVAKSDLSRGILLLGVPGTGKSQFSKCLGGELGVPTIGMDMGKMFGQWVGESEERIRGALAVADAMAPCVLRIDEIEKALGGVSSSHMTDGGTGARVFSTFLNWMQDHTTQVFVIATCNDISKIPPEFLRAERWDAIFFVDLPNAVESKAIVDLYSKMYKVPATDMPVIDNYTGAEIKSLFRIAAMMGASPKEAANFVVPLIRSMQAEIENLRTWAAGKTVPASTGGIGLDNGSEKRPKAKGTGHNDMEVG